jgi:uncharacterized protein (DUF58 family)
MTFTEWLATCETALTLQTATRLRQAQVGEHRSVHSGTGLRLRHHEEYHAGDERRHIDWKASRKEHLLLLRRFEAEPRLEVIVVCDVSASMTFGRHLPKHRIALDCAGILGLAALRQGDAFGLLAFAADTVVYFPPRQRRQAVLQMLEYLWSYEPSEAASTATSFAPVLRHLSGHAPALVCLLSDLRMPDCEAGLEVLSATHDTIAVLIEDAAESALEGLGLIVVRDLESGQSLELDTASAAYREAYRRQMLADRAARQQIVQRCCGAQYLVADHCSDYHGDLLRLFLARTARAWV